MDMTHFLPYTTAIADAGEALVRAAHTAGYTYPFPFHVDFEKNTQGPVLTMQGLQAFACLTRYQSSLKPVQKSHHTRLAIEAEAYRLALALENLDKALRTLPGWPGYDTLGLHMLLSFHLKEPNANATVLGTLCLELATLCPIMGDKARKGQKPLRLTCNHLGHMLDHVWKRTQHWDTNNLYTWHVRDLHTPSSNMSTPVREVFAPTEQDALEADTWWHFQAPLYTTTEYLPPRMATCISSPKIACNQPQTS
jgi:hypothetical protein